MSSDYNVSISTGGSASISVKTRFNSANILFEEDGDFTENINYTATSSYSYYGYTYTDSLTSNSSARGLWSCINTDLLLSFETTESSTNTDYLTAYSSPMNSPFFTGDIYGYNNRVTTERYDIIKLTKSELEMEGTTANGTLVSIKATKN